MPIYLPGQTTNMAERHRTDSGGITRAIGKVYRGNRLIWSKGQIIGFGTNGKFYRITIGNTSLTFTELTYTGARLSTPGTLYGSILPLSGSSFLLMAGTSAPTAIYCTISGNAITGITTLSSHNRAEAAFKIGSDSYILTNMFVANSPSTCDKIAFANRRLSLTRLVSTGSVPSGGGSNPLIITAAAGLDSDAWVILRRNDGNKEIQKITIANNIITWGRRYTLRTTGATNACFGVGNTLYYISGTIVQRTVNPNTADFDRSFDAVTRFGTAPTSFIGANLLA